MQSSLVFYKTRPSGQHLKTMLLSHSVRLAVFESQNIRVSILLNEINGGDPHQPHPGARVHHYRCSLPGLAGFAVYRREGTSADHH